MLRSQRDGTCCRGTETEEQIQKRLRNARAELEEGKTSGIFDHLLVNDEFESCYASFKVVFSHLLWTLFVHFLLFSVLSSSGSEIF